LKIALVISALALAAAAVNADDTATHQHASLPAECSTVRRIAASYLDQHGVSATQQRGVATEDSIPYYDYSLFGGGMHNVSGLKPWTDSRGERISDFRVYWHYANRSDTQKEPFGVWRLRLDRYRMRGEIRLFPKDNSCEVDLRVHFEAGGANMIGFLGVDALWSYGSNGRLEQEYIDGISAELAQQK
jgi:hypothetical protein